MEIHSPTLLVDEAICRNNIRRMAEKARNNQLVLKPHFKTHQCADIGRWFRDEGIRSITVSSVDMAEYFARAGWDDITIAFPCNPREIARINDLAGRLDLSLLVSDPAVAEFLRDHLEHRAGVYIEIDTGSNRTGIPSPDVQAVQSLADTICNSGILEFKGIYSHPGHSYAARTREEILDVHRDVFRRIQRLKEHLGPVSACIGDTPCCSAATDFKGADEISPGNFVFYDLMQTEIGSCTLEDIAVCLAAPVVAVYEQRNEIVVHGGAVHLSKDALEKDGHTLYGYAIPAGERGWEPSVHPGNYVKALSQEHGIIKATSQMISSVRAGDLLGILPVHSCLTANLMRRYRTTRGQWLEC